MGKGRRLKKQRVNIDKGSLKEFSDRLTENFQKEVRNSVMWDQMVKEFGEARANELLKGMKAEVKPGPGPDESWDSTEDIP